MCYRLVLCAAQSCLFLPSPLHRPHYSRSAHFSLTDIIFYARFPSTFSLLRFLSHSSSLSCSIFVVVCSLNMSLSIVFFKSILGNDFGNSAKDHSLKIDNGIVPYDKQDRSPMVVSSVRISGARLLNRK